MRLLRSALLAVLPLASALAAELQENLREISDESIRVALEKTLAGKYQDGVFEHSENAIEALESEDPELVSKVVQVAKQEQNLRLNLAKRQDNTTATTVTATGVVVVSQTVTTTATADVSTPATTPTTVITTTRSPSPTVALTASSVTREQSSLIIAPTAVIQSSQTVLIVPTVFQTVDSAGSSTTLTSASTVASLSTNIVLPVTTTNAQGQTVVSSTTMPAIVLPTTNSAGSAVVMTSPMSTTKPPTATKTSTDANGRVTVITYTPGGGVFSSAVYKITTLPNGQQSTITTYVQAPDATTSTSATVAPTLPPNAAAGRQSFEAAALLGVAVGLFAAL